MVVGCLNSIAQSVFAPIGTYWNYGSADGNMGMKTLLYEKDTVIATYTCKKIKEWWYFSSGGPPPNDSGSAIGYVYERNDSVFQYLPIGSPTFQLLYSFNQTIGDSINLGGTLRLVLDSTTQITLCGTSRRVLYYSKIENALWCTTKDMVKVIEGLAYVSDYLFSQPPSCAVYDGRMNFECLNALGCIYSLYGGACTPLSLGLEPYNTENSAFQMYPNPNNGRVLL